MRVNVLGRVLASVLLAGAVWFGVQSSGLLGSVAEQAAGKPSTVYAQSATSSQDFASAIRQVSGQVKPAVVQITSSQQGLGFSNQAVPQQTGVGSGVIYDPNGYILTNNHVVSGATQLTVALPDGRTFNGQVVGADSQTDLAVVKIQGDNLPVAKLGDSSQLQVGDWLVVIGNALALPGGPTVTQGVVSALNRTVQEPGTGTNSSNGPYLYDLIQTDASINPGNSGGPVVNLQGEVVGISTLAAGMAEPGVQAQGIGFAISINSAKPIVQQLVSTGHAVHPYLGISYTALTPSIARQLGISDTNTKGDVIMQVVQGSPAAQAGLQRLDIITQVDGQNIANESTLGSMMNGHKPGDSVTLTVQRNGQSTQVKVTLGQTPAGS